MEYLNAVYKRNFDMMMVLLLRKHASETKKRSGLLLPYLWETVLFVQYEPLED